MEAFHHFTTETFAPFIITVLEFIGILIIAVGGFRGIVGLLRNGFDFSDRTIKIMLGECLALSLEFKLGAEIIKTVIVRDIQELIILAFVVVLRVVLTFVIHWELKQMEEEDHHEIMKNERQKSLNE